MINPEPIFRKFVYLKIKEMSTAELNGIKLDLIDWIINLSDADLIVFLDGLRVSMNEKDWWKDLSNADKKHIEEGIKDANEGRVMDSKTFWERLRNEDLPSEHSLLLDERLKRVEVGKTSLKKWDLIKNKYDGKVL